MPYHTAKARPHHGRDDLVEKITAEFAGSRPPFVTDPPGAPDIYEEQQRFSDRLHVYVVWDAWEQVPDEIRGEIILDAYERHFGPSRASQISVAMGLTPSEAQRMNLRFETPS